MAQPSLLRGIVATSIRFRLLVIGIAVGLMILGATRLPTARADILPEFTPPYVEVQTEALGLSAEEVEELVTVPLEADLLNGVAFLEEIRSESIAGLSSIVMTFEPGTDIFQARQVVAERLTQAHALPNVSKPPAMLQPLSTENRVMMVSLRSSELSLIDMSVLARWTIRPRLMGIPGVANLSIWGERNRQLQVLVDPTELQQQGVSLGDVISTTGNSLWVSPLTFLEASTPGTGGFIDTPNQRLGIQHVLPIGSAEDLARVVVSTGDSDPTLRLGDVATVVEDHQPLIGDAVVGGGDGLLLVIEKFPGADTVAVTRGIDEALEAMRPGLGGIEIDGAVFRPASFIEASIANVSLALLVGLVLIAIVLGAFLFDWRAALITVVTIPLSLTVAGLAMVTAGAPLNVMVLAGLITAIVVVVDDAAASVASVLDRLGRPREGDKERTSPELVADAVLEGRRPAMSATLLILLFLVPAFFVGGALSAFLPPFAIAYGVAVLASMVVALTVAPAMAVLLLSRRPAERRESPIMPRIRDRYAVALGSLLRRSRPGLLIGSVAALGVVILVGALILPNAGFAAASPSFRTQDLLIHWDGGPGTSRPEMARILSRVTDELRAIPSVQNVDGHVGRAIMSDAITDVNSGEIWLKVDTSADYDRTVAAVTSTVDGYPGLGTAIVTYPQERINEVLSGTGHDAVVRIYGHDLSVLRDRAEEVRAAIATITGVDEASVLAPVEQPALEVVVDLEAADALGLRAGDVRRTATTLLSGIEVGLLFEEQKVFEVVVWGEPDLRASVSDVENLMIETPAGELVRLNEVADVRVAPTPSVITREGVRRIMEVGVNASGRDLQSVLRDVEAAVGAIEFPLEYHAEVFSEAADGEAAQLTFLAVLAGVTVMAFLVLQAAVASWRLAAAVFVTLPAALAGGILTGLAAGELGSIGTLAGVFAVLAISARTCISLIDHVRRLERTGQHGAGSQLVLAGATDRLGLTLTSVLATAVGLLPFVFVGDVAGLEIVRPMAIFVIGGLITSTLWTLFLVPDLCMRSGPSAQADTEDLLSEQPALEPTMAQEGLT